MTDSNQPAHTAIVEVTYSSAKAIAGAVVGAVLAFLTPIATTLHAGQPVTAVTWLDSAIAALVFAGGIFGTVYQVTNKPRFTERPIEADQDGIFTL